MNCCTRAHDFIFPWDFTDIADRGKGMEPKKYTIFRVIMFLLYLADFTYCACFFQKKDLLYFTNWGLIITMLCGLILTVQNLINWKLKKTSEGMIWKAGHFIFTLILVFQMLITGVYWCGIFPYGVIFLWGDLGFYDIFNPIMAHGVPVLLLFIDLLFNSVVVWNWAFIPFQLGLLTIYLIVNCVYTLQVSVIYDILTYKNVVSYLFIIACGLVVLFCHLLARLFCKFCKQKKILRLVYNPQQKVSLFSQIPTLPKRERQSIKQGNYMQIQ